VVPHLFPLGFLPVLRRFPPEVADGLDQLSPLHNQVLPLELARFAAEKPDATITQIDMNRTFLDLLDTTTPI